MAASGQFSWPPVGGNRWPLTLTRLGGPITLAGKVPGEAMPGVGPLRRFRIRLSPVDRAAVTMNRGRGAGSLLPYLPWTPLTPPLTGFGNQDYCLIRSPDAASPGRGRQHDARLRSHSPFAGWTNGLKPIDLRQYS